MDENVGRKLESIEQHYTELEEMMAQPEIATDHRRITELGRERAELQELVDAYRRYQKIRQEIDSTEEMLNGESDPEMVEMTRAELDELRKQLDVEMTEIKRLLLPKDKDDDKDVII